MKKHIRITIASALAVATAGAMAFTTEPSPVVKKDFSKTAEAADSLETFVRNVRSLVRKAEGKSPRRSAPESVRAAAVSAGDKVFGGVVYADTWSASYTPYGIYSSTTSKPIEVQPEYISDRYKVEGGGFYNEGKYYFIDYTIQSFDGVDYVYTYLYECEAYPFSYKAEYSLGMSNISRDMTFDPIDQKVYGIFSVGNLESTYLIGRMNLDTKNKNFAVEELLFLDETTNQVAIAADARGNIYTIGVDGNLYRFDKQACELVKIGATGVRNIEIRYPQSATIDLATGTFYWAALKTDGSSALYTVNTATGRATKVDDFPDNEEFVGLYVPDMPADGAPVQLDELYPDFIDGSLTGVVAFDAPKTSINGNTLSGELGYTLLINGEEAYTGSVRAGRRNEEIEVTLPDNGWYTFTVTTSNASGKSVPKSLRTFVGKDAPTACPNPTAVNAYRDNDVTVKWGKPQKGVNGGYVDPQRLTYDVERMPGNVLLASEITDTVFYDHVPSDDLHTYYYIITARHDGIAGTPSATNKVAVGYVAQVPYEENFDTQVDFDTYTVAHLNGVELTYNDWGTWNYTAYKGGVAQSSPSDGTAKDDWLFTPPIHLTPEQVYKLRFKAMSQGNSIVPSFIEYMEVKMGTAPDVDHMNTLLVENGPVLNQYGFFLDYEALITVDREGEYHIGFHATTPAADLMWMLNLDDIIVEFGPEMEGPSRVSDFNVECLPKGALGAVISFTAPSRSLKNEPLESLDEIRIYRGESEIKVIESPTPGSAVTYTDNEAVQGVNEYTVVAYAKGEKGMSDKRSVFVGFDIPGELPFVKLEEVDGVPVVTWGMPSEEGPNGHYVDPEKVTYTVERYFSARDREVVAENISALTFSDSNLSRTDQAPVTYIVTPSNHIGAGEQEYSNSMFVGDALSELPLRESFPQCYSTSPLAYLSASEDCAWGVIDSYEDLGVTPYDNDGGMAVFYVYSDDAAPEEGFSQNLYTNRFNLEGSVKPAVSFYIFNMKGSANGISVVVNPESKGWEEVEFVPVDESGKTGWRQVVVSLEKYVGKRFVQFGLKGIGYDYGMVFVDNILFDDMLDHNLQLASITAPGIVEMGQTAVVETTVVNRGLNDAEGYSVNFYRNGILMSSQNGTRIAPGMSIQVDMTFVANVDCEEQNDIYAEIDYSLDQKESDNRSETVSVFADLPRMAYVNDLSGELSGSNVGLKWSAPDASTALPEPVTDGFDDYESFIIDNIGPWTTIDGDGNATWGITSGISGQILQYPHAGQPMAWQVFNPVKAGLTTDYNPGSDTSGTQVPDWRPRSGSQMLGSFASRIGSNNDWLISPELTGDVQLVKFYARSILNLYPETFEVLVSTTDSNTDSFTAVSRYTVGMKWTSVAVVVPEGTKYVAIRCISTNQFALMIDDITYAPYGAEPANAQFKGYNVYVDGTKVTPQPVAATEFTVSTDGFEHRYGVTAVYDLGESRMSNIVTLGILGVGNVSNDPAGALSVRNVAGGLSLTAEGAFATVYAPSGTAIWAGEVNGTVKVSLEPGVYIVSSDVSTPVKTVVK